MRNKNIRIRGRIFGFWFFLVIVTTWFSLLIGLPVALITNNGWWLVGFIFTPISWVVELLETKKEKGGAFYIFKR